jgi:hypothetical protein
MAQIPNIEIRASDSGVDKREAKHRDKAKKEGAEWTANPSFFVAVSTGQTPNSASAPTLIPSPATATRASPSLPSSIRFPDTLSSTWYVTPALIDT